MSGGHWVVVVAAGRGRRAALGQNKVFAPIAGRSALSRCLDRLWGAGCYDGCVLVLAPEDRARYGELVRAEGACPLVKRIADGGATRQASVRGALRLVPEGAETISVHDAARALVPASVLAATLRSAIERGSGVAATRLTDTVKRADGAERGVETLDRAPLRAVQTPQAFRAPLLRRAHAEAERDGFEATDDAALVERYAGPVSLCVSDGGRMNMKLTTAEDVWMMERLVGAAPRVGHGYDVHRLVPGRRLVLCGVEVPFEMGLLGHSDADVAAHALMDALLGACALGDIGRHFPDADERYRGADSMALLEAVVGMVRAAGYAVGNADVTIVCERPKVAGHADAMRARLARAMGVEVGAVNVKATTTEALGFTGRGEGIAAHASALLTPAREAPWDSKG